MHVVKWKTALCRMGTMTNVECRMMNEVARATSSSFRQGPQIFILLITILLVFTYPVGGEIDQQYKEQINSLTTKLLTTGFSEEEIQRIFSDERVELYPQILERSAKGLPYFNKKFGLLTKKSIERGKKVLTDNYDVLVRVENSYGVDKEIIIAILRVETNFNRYVGKYPIFNSLLTLAIIENRRSAWAEGELAELLRISKNLGKDPLSIKGSWAGAFGMAQFIPSSYMKYAVDGNNDGTVDLFDFSDATASIANYLKAHGWEKDSPDKNWKAVYAYNHCDEYVKAIFAYAKALKTAPSRKKRT
jgi:membrane-bound lytic murein transglycosylase B